MISNLQGYEVSEEELQAYLVTLAAPTFNVTVTKLGDVYNVKLDGKLLYYSEQKVTKESEIERLTNNWLTEQAQIYFADRFIPAVDSEPFEPLSNEMVVLEGIAANYEQTLMLQESVTAVMEGLADLYELNLGG
ncbi:hypothetical protein [Dielma fastidiosa]|uniref:hypothetical protein n=1 Tax=Dielma fastidiosa TaxID=1034346 RepID=UPI0023F2120B|nr:hypothetical protein [Dielma fastidiosa]